MGQACDHGPLDQPARRNRCRGPARVPDSLQDPGALKRGGRRSALQVGRLRAADYFAPAGNAGNLPMSRASCWMTSVALKTSTIFFMREIEASVSARSKLNAGTPSVS